MKPIITAILIIISSGIFTAQNLIVNGGFEAQTKCPQTLGDFYVSNWHSTLRGRKTPDYFSDCGTSENFSSPNNYLISVPPYKGKSYIGIVGYNPMNGYREYVTTELSAPMKAGEKYVLSVMISQPALSNHYLNNLGILFTKDTLNVNKLPSTLIIEADINIKTKDFLECREKWFPYSFEYVAQGGERYLHLGCFLTDEKLLYRTYYDRADFCRKTGYNDAYYLFDEISLVQKSSTSQVATTKEILIAQTPLETFVFEDVKFGSGDFSSGETSFQQFDKLIDYLKQNPNLKILIEGHTDDVGSAEDNLTLSDERSLFVKSYFVSKDISNEIFTIGYGESTPLMVGISKEIRRKNRRVVVKVY